MDSEKPPPTLAPFNPTADDAIGAALAFLQLRAGDVVVDLGCGCGKFLLAAARACEGVVCRGYEYDAGVLERGKERLARAVAAGGREAEAASRVTLVLGDASRPSLLEDASVAFVYLVPTGLQLVQRGLLGVLERGGRLASNMFQAPGCDAFLRRRLVLRGAPLYLYGPEALVAGIGGGQQKL